MRTKTHIVTGAFGYTGRYIALELIKRGFKVLTLSNAINRTDPFNGAVEHLNFNFNDQQSLITHLKRGSVLYNTYWVRYNCNKFGFDQAIDNTKKLLEAAKIAKIDHIIHYSVTNPDKSNGLKYFEGKKIVEELIINSGLSCTIIRPALIFAQGDILINNIAWCLRKFPLFCIPGKGDYKLDPIYAEDLAGLSIDFAISKQNCVVDAIGPESYTFKEFVELTANATGCKKPLICCPPDLALIPANIISLIVKDTIITRSEIEGLMQNLLHVESEPSGQTKFSEWIKENASEIGQNYNSELKKRHYKL